MDGAVREHVQFARARIGADTSEPTRFRCSRIRSGEYVGYVATVTAPDCNGVFLHLPQGLPLLFLGEKQPSAFVHRARPLPGRREPRIVGRQLGLHRCIVTAMAVDPGAVKAVVEALGKAHVRYLVVGGLAVRAHGYLRDTKDMDLVLHLSPQNALAGLEVLARFGYRPTVPVALEAFADPTKRKEWVEEKGATVLNLYSDRHPTTSVDLFVTEPFDFDRAYAAGLDAEIVKEATARVVSLDDLIEMKERAGRPKDLADIHQLERIRDRERDGDSGPSR